jgi:hypothetical protein
MLGGLLLKLNGYVPAGESLLENPAEGERDIRLRLSPQAAKIRQRESYVFRVVVGTGCGSSTVP